MSKIAIKEIRDAVFGNCLKLENGLIELVVALDFGPRIIHFSLCGKENMFYTDPEKKPLGDMLEVYGTERCILYGGHRIWISPEILPRCYHPDNEPVTAEQSENGVIVKGAIEKFNNIQKIMEINMFPDLPEVEINHSIVNCGMWDIEYACWCITMFDKGGKGIIPMPSDKTGLLHNRSISLWDYSDMSDKRVYWGKDFITLKQDPNCATPFKLGINNTDGWGAYFNKGQAFFKFFEPNNDGILPDNGCSYESYTNDFMFEAETLSEIALVEPGGVLSHTEEWEIYETDGIPGNDETEIRKAVEKYLTKRI